MCTTDSFNPLLAYLWLFPFAIFFIATLVESVVLLTKKTTSTFILQQWAENGELCSSFVWQD